LGFVLVFSNLYSQSWSDLAGTAASDDNDSFQASLLGFYDPFLSAFGGAMNMRLIYPWHIESLTGFYNGELGMGMDFLQFIWEPGGIFKFRIGFGLPVMLYFKKEPSFSITPQVIMGLSYGGEKIAFFAEARPGFKIEMGYEASSGFSMPIILGIVFLSNIF
jgi:hypothetical protein